MNILSGERTIIQFVYILKHKITPYILMGPYLYTKSIKTSQGRMHNDQDSGTWRGKGLKME